MSHSLQSRLLLGLLGGTSLVLIASGVVLYTLIRLNLIAEFDAALISEATLLASLVEDNDGLIQTEMAEHGLPITAAEQKQIYFQLWSHDGASLERSHNLGTSQLMRLKKKSAQPEIRPVLLPAGRKGRLVEYRFIPHQDEGSLNEQRLSKNDENQKAMVTLVIARDTWKLDATLNQMGILLASVFGVTVLTLLAVITPIVRISLIPLKKISSQIESLDATTLTERLDVANTPEEIRLVIDCLNELFKKLDAAFRRERAFSANVAHELRTPLAGLRSTIDVALLKPRQASEYQRSIEQCLGICKQMESLTENLLVLARLDAGQYKLHPEMIELTDLTHKIFSAFETRADSRCLKITWLLDDEITLNTDPMLLTIILQNLFDNAICYANKGSQIEVVTCLHNETASMTIQNRTTGLPLDLPAQIFDRFWRADISRTETGHHAGLGLSLCKEVARILGMELIVAVQDSIFSVQLKCQSSDANKR